MRTHVLTFSAALLLPTAPAPAALNVTQAERTIVAWAAGYDYEFDVIESDGATTLVPEGPFVVTPAIDLDDYYGLDVAEGSAALDSEITSSAVRFSIAATGTVEAASTFQADGGGDGAVHVSFTLAAPTRVSFDASGVTNAGYVLAGVSLRPAESGPALASGYLQAQTQFQTWFAGVLPAGDYLLDGDLQAWAYGGAGTDSFADGAIEVELVAYHVADVDMSGAVGFSDLSMMLEDWGACDECPSDLDLDGATGFTDLNTLLAAWGE